MGQGLRLTRSLGTVFSSFRELNPRNTLRAVPTLVNRIKIERKFSFAIKMMMRA